jgi:hypothetical protein
MMEQQPAMVDISMTKILTFLCLTLTFSLSWAGPCEDKLRYCDGSSANASRCESATERCSSAGDMMSKARQSRDRAPDGESGNLDQGLRDLPKEQADTIRETLEIFKLPGGLGR